MSELDFDTACLITRLTNTALAPWSEALGKAVLDLGHSLKHGHLPRWNAALQALPSVDDSQWHVSEGKVCVTGTFAPEQITTLNSALRELIPWRKGPFDIGPVNIDTEWRSDWKWERIAEHLQPLDERIVLDVGCGSGYHLWRMRNAGAKLALGIDPSLLFLKQFEAIQHYAREEFVHFLPLPMEALPSNMKVFDTLFSMGVLYHRRDPMAHLQELLQALRPGGELVLETLIIPNDHDTVLPISDRYANMRNIYELPSLKRLHSWVNAAGFHHIRTVSVEQTSCKEQRTTAWMPSYSLEQALDSDDPSVTIEGYPRPLRAVVIAQS